MALWKPACESAQMIEKGQVDFSELNFPMVTIHEKPLEFGRLGNCWRRDRKEKR